MDLAKAIKTLEPLTEIKDGYMPVISTKEKCEAVSIAINALKTIDWMRTEYEHKVDLLEQDIEDKSINRMGLGTELSVYKRVLSDMEGVEEIDE